METTGVWTGFYAGIFVGAGGGTHLDPQPLIEMEGLQAGVVAGFDHALENGVVLGIAADLAAANYYEAVDGGFPLAAGIGREASLRGRVGYDAGNFMPYVSAGLALAEASFTAYGVTESRWHSGWTAGAGVEVAIAENLALDLNYRFSNYGYQNYFIDDGGGNTIDLDLALRSHRISAGLNLRF